MHNARVPADSAPDVSPHDLDHVIHTAESRGVEASDDIISHNGFRLLAKAERLDAELQMELMTVVAELEWRLRELERESLLRAGLLHADESAVMRELIARLKGDTA